VRTSIFVAVAKTAVIVFTSKPHTFNASGEHMSEKQRILIVDDEVSVLTVLKSSLKKLGDGYEVDTAANGLKALAQLRERPYDVVVTDYQMDSMNGLELLDAVHAINPDTRVIMITAYGTDRLEMEARQREAYEYLAKPLEIQAFRQVVQDALDEMAISRPGILILSDKRFRHVMELMEELKTDVGARFLFLSDAGGRVLARSGEPDTLVLEEIVPLLGGGISTIIEVGRALDGNVNTINLTYREGDRENLFIVNIGQQILLTIVVEQTRYSSKLGSVWYYARKAAVALREAVGDIDFTSPPDMLLDDDVQQAFDDGLDDLLLFD